MSDSKPTSNENDRLGTTAAFPYDRMTVERFRKTFPRARWNDDLKAWFVPGKTAARRFDRWLERERSQTETHADAKGRDAFVFDPIGSKYLRRLDSHLEVVTPYSRTVVDEMRQVPFASWDADRRVWTIPYRSYEALHQHWNRIEEAAKRNEPVERKKRREANRGSEKERAARVHATERRRRRYPLDPENLPPFGRPVMTSNYGIVVFLGSDGEPVDPEIIHTSYSDVPISSDSVWGRWRPATHAELVATWPARPGSKIEEGIWRQPTLAELRVARKTAGSRERRRSRAGG
ncbi:hypothetical protein [Mesorhizobium argentiipisi]|uniref:HARP domain-containing protein n=1 Tax=Mesorhizobium argentiipisi TaxID=3015175 RepID=A0ABU8KAA0_9HYPH